METSYDREKDIVLIELSGEDIDYAEEAGPMVIHFTENHVPVLVEILDASDFLTELTKTSMRSDSGNHLRYRREARQ